MKSLDEALLAHLRTLDNRRMGEGSLKVWCRAQKPPINIYKAEDAMGRLVEHGLLEASVRRSDGATTWQLVERQPEPPPAPAKAKPAPAPLPAPEPEPVASPAPPEPTPAMEHAPEPTPEPPPSGPRQVQVQTPFPREPESPSLHDLVQSAVADEPRAQRQALGRLLVKIGESLIGGTAAAGAAATLGAEGEPEGLVGHQLAVWRALSAEEGRTPKELGAASGVGRDSVPSALRGLAVRKLAFSPRYGLWKRTA